MTKSQKCGCHRDLHLFASAAITPNEPHISINMSPIFLLLQYSSLYSSYIHYTVVWSYKLGKWMTKSRKCCSHGHARLFFVSCHHSERTAFLYEYVTDSTSSILIYSVDILHTRYRILVLLARKMNDAKRKRRLSSWCVCDVFVRRHLR